MQIQNLIRQVGKKKAFKYLRAYFKQPENIAQYTCLFPNHITNHTPDFHKEILLDMPKGGRQAVVSYRGSAKSTMTNVIGGSWFSLYSKYHFILLISDTYTQAKLQLGALKSELENNKLIHSIYGNPVSGLWGEDRIIINTYAGEQVMIMALGAGMKIRGLKFKQYRPELAIIDDLENQEVVSSKERREKLERWFEYDLLPGLSADNRNIIYLGTILHEYSLLNKIKKKVGKYASWNVKVFTALNENQESTWPDRFPTEKLIAMRDNPLDPDYMGSLVFAQEMQNVPQSDTDRIFKTDWLSESFKLQEKKHVWEMQNPNAEFYKTYFSRIVAGVDLAISEKETADYFSMMTIGIARDDGHIYILDYFRERISDPMKQIDTILNKYLEWQHDQIKVETVAYQKALYNLLRSEGAKRNIYPPIKAVRPDADKIRRARVHSSNFSGKLVHLREDHPLYMTFKDELLQFPLGEHDDMLDAYMYATEETIKPRARVFKKKPSVFM